jgi:predicted RNA-binding Zn-ribbon protein involved in translation (DUF1610 family)
MAKRPPKRSERTLRREQERTVTRLRDDRERLFRLEPGGNPDHPLDASSAAVIEAHAMGVPCPQCGASQEVTEHVALVHGPERVRLRETKLRCRQCGSTRSLWFKIVGTGPN